MLIAEEIFQGVRDGFRIVDDAFDGSYHCDNYNSILDSEFRTKMDSVVASEILEHKVIDAPECVHSLGAVCKADGGLRPITDCKHPLGSSINNYMESVCEDFHFIEIDDVTDIMEPRCYFSVIDIKAAYMSVNVFPPHRTYQGFVWNIGGEDCYFQDNCLCFGLKCAPYIFSQISDFVIRCMRRGHNRVFSYLDDFIVLDDSEKVVGLLQKFSYLFGEGWDFILLGTSYVLQRNRQYIWN